MAKKGRQSWQKREREKIQQLRYREKQNRRLQAKERKAAEKELRRQEAKERKSGTAHGDHTDPDLAGIVPGPQPLPEAWDN